MTLSAAVDPMERSKPSTMRVKVTPIANIPTMVIPSNIENMFDQLQKAGSARPKPINEAAMTIKNPYLIANALNFPNLYPFYSCVIKLKSSSRSASDVVYSPRIAPLFITTIRSVTSINSSISLEIITTALSRVLFRR